MIATEERLRAATRAAAATVPPGSAPPCGCPVSRFAGAAARTGTSTAAAGCGR